MAYTTLADVKVYLNISTGVTGDDTIISSLITAAQTQIESKCKRVFEATTGTYYYRADDLKVLPIGSQFRPVGTYYGYAGQKSWDVWPDQSYSGQYGHTVLWLGRDLLSVTGLTNGDGTTMTSTQYWLEPRNQAPYQWIRLRTGNAWVFQTDGEITVVGNWGFTSAAPDDIVQATKRLAAYLYRQRDSSVFDVQASPELGIITVPQGFPADVERILRDGGYLRGGGLKGIW